MFSTCFPQVAPVFANFATDSTAVHLGSILHNVFIQLPSVPACNQQESTTVHCTLNIYSVPESLEQVLMHTTDVVI